MSRPRHAVLLGEITRVHGVRGEVVIRSYTANPEAIGDYGLLSTESGERTFNILSARSTPKGVIARIADVENRDAAERLRGVKLYVDRDALPAAEDGTFYFEDLVGLTTVDAAGTAFGTITAVHNFGAGDLLEVSIAGVATSELVPFSDAFVPDVDIAARRATVLLPVAAAEDSEERDE